MAAITRQTEPDHNATGCPRGVPCIIGNEGCERFRFYGMKTTPLVQLTALFVTAGRMDVASILLAIHASFHQFRECTH